jgi:hypothetical protein
MPIWWERPWFVCSVSCNGAYCGRQVTRLYGAGRLFACRHCYRLAYASQQESIHQRGLWKAQKIRMRLGGSASLADEFPEKPKAMHWRTYDRLCRLHDVAEERSTVGMMRFVLSAADVRGTLPAEASAPALATHRIRQHKSP